MEYLVVWERSVSSGFGSQPDVEVWGQRIGGPNGGEVGIDFSISNMGADARADQPAVVANSAATEFFVVWRGDLDPGPGTEFEIVGQRIAFGAEVGLNDFRISQMGPNGAGQFGADTPDVAHNPATDEYLVVWQGDSNTGGLVDDEFEIFGQFLTRGGSETGPNDFRLSDMGPDGDPSKQARFPAVASNRAGGESLVVWGGDDATAPLADDEFEIFGQRFVSTTRCTAGPTPSGSGRARDQPGLLPRPERQLLGHPGRVRGRRGTVHLALRPDERRRHPGPVSDHGSPVLVRVRELRSPTRLYRPRPAAYPGGRSVVGGRAGRNRADLAIPRGRGHAVGPAPDLPVTRVRRFAMPPRRWALLVVVGGILTLGQVQGVDRRGGPVRVGTCADCLVRIPSFIEDTVNAGLTFRHQSGITRPGERHMMTPGVAVADFDRDGHLDVFVGGGAGQNAALFLNNRDGTFADRAAAWGIDLRAVETSSATVGDLDGDGLLDLYVGVLDARNRPYHNVHGIRFEEFGVASGATLLDGMSFNTTGTAMGDVDADGDLDLVTADWTTPSPALGRMRGNRLFVNRGQDGFVDRTTESGLSRLLPVRGFTPVLVDLDGDRFPELTMAADFGTSQYYANVSGLGFTQLTTNGTGTDENGMGSTFGDVDNDGDLDWFVTSIFDDDGQVEGNWGRSGNRLYRNEGGHAFTDATDRAGVRNGYWGWGASFGDFNHDGWLDLAQTNGFSLDGSNPDPTYLTDPTRLWINCGDLQAIPLYVEASAEAGITHTQQGRGLVSFDADLDGDLDLLISTNRGDLVFYRNTRPPDPSTWLQVDLAGPVGHAPDGIGARAELQVGATTYHRAVVAGSSFMSQAPLRMHFGFPSTNTIARLTVHWADGSSTVLTDVAPGRVVTVNACGVISPPTNLAAVVVESGVKLSWDGRAACRPTVLCHRGWGGGGVLGRGAAIRHRHRRDIADGARRAPGNLRYPRPCHGWRTHERTLERRERSGAVIRECLGRGIVGRAAVRMSVEGTNVTGASAGSRSPRSRYSFWGP